MVCLPRSVSLFLGLALLLLSSCASLPEKPLKDHGLAYTIYNRAGLLHRHVPVFIVEEAEKAYNRIGTPEASSEAGQEAVTVNPEKGSIYTAVHEFSTSKGSYSNLIYRLHFSEIPFSIFPYHLGTGKNVGLIIVVTLDSRSRPVLYTLVHTCGCYLAFIPTTSLDRDCLPKHWRKGRQQIYGESLPSLLNLDGGGENLLAVQLRTAAHRVKDVWLSTTQELAKYRQVRLQVLPFKALEAIPLPDGGVISFYETEGARKGYVRGSQKLWERLFISWWALDWRVGEDKKLGSSRDDGPVFYTSLKPWAREESDMRDFPGFLRYWGWQF